MPSQNSFGFLSPVVKKHSSIIYNAFDSSENVSHLPSMQASLGSFAYAGPEPE